jgi:hypothetical protein
VRFAVIPVSYLDESSSDLDLSFLFLFCLFFFFFLSEIYSFRMKLFHCILACLPTFSLAVAALNKEASTVLSKLPNCAVYIHFA